MILSYLYIRQDTVKTKISTTNQGQQPVAKNLQTADSVKKHVFVQQNTRPDTSDTVSVCSRNSIADVTFFDPANVVYEIGKQPVRQFPFIFIDKVKEKEARDKVVLLKHLRSGTDRPAEPLHPDWMVIILIASAFLFSFIKQTSTNLTSRFAKFFMFKGITDPVSRDIGGLFYWQSTLMNLISFFIIGLFCYSAAEYYDLIPAGIKGILIWLIAIALISLAVTLRHLACLVTGAVSGEQEVFREYLLGIYQSYRFAALFLSVIIVMMAYTRILPANDLIISGLAILGLIYLIRVIRLLIIFINRNISIFYLILYLCALEILPVLIVVKYFTGLV